MAVAVMVVDRNSIIRMLLSETSHVLGYGAVEAGCCVDAVRVLATLPRLDLLLAEWGPAGGGGLGLAHAARDRFPGVPVLFLGSGDDACEGLAQPCGVLRKPFTMAEALTQIRRLLG